MTYVWWCAKKLHILEIKSFLFLVACFYPFLALATTSSFSSVLGYNPDTRFEDNAQVSKTRINFALDKKVHLLMDYGLLTTGSKNSQAYGVGLTLGSAASILVRMQHEFADKNNYLPRDRTRLFFLRRLKGKPVAGFYEFMNAYYSFANNRSIDMSVGHFHRNEWLRIGVSGEHWSGEIPQIKVFFSINQQAIRRQQSFSAKLYLGTHQRVAQQTVLDAEKGLHIIVQGDLPLGYFSKNLNVVYRYNAMLLEKSFDTGISLGLRYWF